MDKYFTDREQAEMLIRLVESLNLGNSCDCYERVGIAKNQLGQLKIAIEQLRNEAN